MDPLQNGTESEEDCQGAEEEEEMDPRIQGELEKLNQSTDDINRWESELEEFRQRFRAVLVEATVKLDEQVKKIGRAVDDSKPYWEARKVARQAQVEAQKATQEFQRAVEILRAAKETIALAEERLLEEDSRQFDSAWQEMLNHATQRVMEAEQARVRSEAEHKKTAANYTSCIGHMKQLEKKLKRSINKSKPYFELKAKYYLQLEQLKRQVDERQAKLVAAKAEYRATLRRLERISEEIHAQRRSVGARGRGVGAELDGGGDGEDVAAFAMDCDGLSMVSVSMDDDSEEDARSASSTPTTSVTLDTASPQLPTSLRHTPPSPSSSCSSSPGDPEVASPCSSRGSDSVCGSGRGSPLLGPRSQCSGASSPDCDQERGDRAEGAEATLEGGLSGLNLTIAQTQPNDNDAPEDEKATECASNELPSTSNILLLNAA
ncbi:SH3 domain-binding protein 5 [Syngnathoides biaculeatus]|uniref:SH3 domain-binding protein 5 n=1 Tax=Syngnathoides biaculeatus TaxID=300417 RepID=UPI002ADD7C54|nr:SH3 domain-binding protein 5 [Syngnathoides biaculeatus]